MEFAGDAPQSGARLSLVHRPGEEGKGQATMEPTESPQVFGQIELFGHRTVQKRGGERVDGLTLTDVPRQGLRRFRGLRPAPRRLQALRPAGC